MENKTYLQKLTLCALFATLTAAGAFIKIPLPFTPVPITLQTLFVLLSGAVLGGPFGALSQIIYILLGVTGLPIFAGALAGPMALMGPTGGYLIGFVFCAFIVGIICQIAGLGSGPKPARWSRGRNLFWLYFSIFVIGSIVICLFGAAGLMLFMRISLKKAVVAGILPFIAGDLLKILAAAYLAVKINKFTECK